MYKTDPISLVADFSTETSQAKREWDNMFRMLKEKNCHLKILYVAQLFFKNEKGK